MSDVKWFGAAGSRQVRSQPVDIVVARLRRWMGWLVPWIATCRLFASDPNADRLASFNVRWSSPSTNTWGTMPLGNGDLAVNALVEPGGDLVLLLAKADAWDAHARLVKLGRVRLSLEPRLFLAGRPFTQELRLQNGVMVVETGGADDRVTLKLWVDANHPAVRVDVEARQAVQARCRLELWRTRERVLETEEATGSETFAASEPVISYPDEVLETEPDALVWHHRNTRSVWEATLRHQAMAAWIPQGRDPLLGRTFGGWVGGDGWVRRGSSELERTKPSKRFSLDIVALTAQTASVDDWTARLQNAVRAASSGGVRSRSRSRQESAHLQWWREFWNRSWIWISTTDAGESEAVRRLNQGYVLQRYLNACAGRGTLPIKFNGSLFTVPLPDKFDPDYRRWGGCYWFQNTRLIYWPMLASGDLDLMEPLFRMYREALPLAMARTKLHFDHDGAYFPETQHFWGAWHNGDYGWGWARTNEPSNRALNQYIRFHWSGGLELLSMMLAREAQAPDPGFVRETLLPHADAVLTFYERHYPRQPDGRILFVPAQALETWWETENPTPEVAGLSTVLDQLARGSISTVGNERLDQWRKLRAALPPVPRRTTEEKTFVLPAEAFRTQQNMENAELYAVFPFRVFGVGRPDLEVGIETFRRRQFKGNVGWQQDETQAAMLGLVSDARRMLLDRASRKHEESRFPAFWGPNFDWIPDQDHGGNLMMALQTMLLQEVDDRVLLLPAWPSSWDADFRLHAAGRTVVDGVVREGRIHKLEVSPRARRDAVEVFGATGASGK
jgi:alpha-L-fucosidase 2